MVSPTLPTNTTEHHRTLPTNGEFLFQRKLMIKFFMFFDLGYKDTTIILNFQIFFYRGGL